MLNCFEQVFIGFNRAAAADNAQIIIAERIAHYLSELAQIVIGQVQNFVAGLLAHLLRNTLDMCQRRLRKAHGIG